MNADCIFCQLAAGQIPADIRARGQDWLVFSDIAPVAPVHLLAIPARHVSGVADLDDGDVTLIGQLVRALTREAVAMGIADDGYRLVINQGRDGLQSVPHLHVHLLAGRPMTWPPG